MMPKYSSTKHFSEETKPRPPSDYAGNHMEWDENLDAETNAETDEEEAEARVRSDEQIEDSVLGALSSEPLMDTSQIDVQVIKGVVLLTGNVANEKIKQAAEKRLGQIPGIREIKNQLSLHPR